ncbi:MAG: iron-containing alcohol dehydrogenase [Lachnospiraceae bacterium]|jgi:alcohol dehydrogenase YqhD (iron-dependent ADH family)|nr:iron-containing alcohol dehydrogenase [Lachnospiraceae bacterium]MEE1164023.1 iron-containing alcohol dehydrogenase [Lachnospiraceae bacterium]
MIRTADFDFYAPTKVIFGKGAERRLGALVKEQGCSKVLIHYGGKSAVRSGLIDRVCASLDEAGISHVSLGGVVPNPHLGLVYEGIELGKKEGVDFILAVGGGSVIDSAKAIGYGIADPEQGDVWDFYVKKRKSTACLPVGVVLTIAAAGSEMSNDSVITNEKTGIKRGHGNDISRAKFAIMNPELTMTLPDYQSMSGCTDIMMHTMERYFTNNGNMELTDSIAEGLLRTVKKYTRIIHEEPDNYEARAEVMWAGSLSHNGLTGCGAKERDFASHILEHELGGMFDVTHGAGLAAIWGTWARYVYKNCLDRFVKFALNVMEVKPGATDEETALKGIEAMEDFYRSIGMPTSIHELGVDPTEEQIKIMAHNAIIASGGKRGSARVLYEDDFVEIYKAALNR